MLFRSVRLAAFAVMTLVSLIVPHGARGHVARRPLLAPDAQRTRPAPRHPRSARWPWGITPQMMAAASRVHDCEQPNSWGNLGIFPGGIGMTDANWQQFRLPGMPRHAAWIDGARVRSATPRAQARVLYRFSDHYFGGQLPDQGGTCAAY